MSEYSISDKKISDEIFFSFRIKKIKDNEVDKNITLENWKPEHREKKIIMSEWRKRQNARYQSIKMPNFCDYVKIKNFLKNKVEDSEIIRIFAISQSLLDKIKTRPFHQINNSNYLMGKINKSDGE